MALLKLKLDAYICKFRAKLSVHESVLKLVAFLSWQLNNKLLNSCSGQQDKRLSNKNASTPNVATRHSQVNST